MNIKKLFSLIVLISSFSGVAISKPLSSSPSADLGVINEERILYWLEKRGELSTNATEQQQQQAIENYLTNKSFNPKKLPGKLGEKVMQAQRKGLVQNKAQTFAQLPKMISGTEKVTNDVKVLAIMIDFSDLKYNDNGLSPQDTGMFYSDYSKEHYNNLLFSHTGYSGPAGQNLESAYQYYQQESGQSLNFTGNALGWVTASKTAEHYGGNNAEGDDQNVSALVLEAVSKAVSELNIDLKEYDKSDFFDFDGDGNINEPDGIIDHVMIIHSSIGEEAGGGTLGENAIWSHRFFVFDENNQPMSVPGSDIKLYGYTITPIDAATGVVVHEFGHDLGVPDEYDTAYGAISSPVAHWSLMSSGSWLGSPAGTKPSGFSPFAKDYFQTRYQGNWINQQYLELTDLTTESLELVAAVNKQAGINQIKINLPKSEIAFGAPYSGEYQFYSSYGHDINNHMEFELSLPEGNATLSMKARWEIELDYDYIQVLVNDKPIQGNHTKVDNTIYKDVKHSLSGSSSNITGAQGALSWVDLTFDLTEFQQQNVTVKIIYKTDTAGGGFGFVTDEIKVFNNDELFSHDAERSGDVALSGFSRIGTTIPGAAHNYYIQLRNFSGVDSALSAVNYEPGVLLWYRNDNIIDNNVNEHPGDVFTGVIDADQHPILQGASLANTDIQIRDAAFSIYDQTSLPGDNYLTANAKFDDKTSYAMEQQPASGIVIKKYGLTMEVTAQNSNHTSASLLLNKSDLAEILAQKNGLKIQLSVADDEVSESSEFVWQMGDNTVLHGASVEHTYVQSGEYTVSVAYNTQSGEKTLSYEILVGEAITGEISVTQSEQRFSFTPILSGGYGNFTYRWEFGDNTEAMLSEVAEHEYSQQGRYLVKLYVTDETLVSYELSLDVLVEFALIANFDKQIDGLTVNFNANVNGGDEQYTYLWDFGDTTTSSSKNTEHKYIEEGDYTITFTVTDGSGSQIVVTDTVTVVAPVLPPAITTTTTSNIGNSDSGGAFNFWLFICVSFCLFRRTKYLA